MSCSRYRQSRITNGRLTSSAKFILQRKAVWIFAEQWLGLPKASERNNQFAQYQLGSYILQVSSHPRTPKSSCLFYIIRRARQSVFPIHSGKLYLIGNAVPRDKEIAIRWFMLSAAQGNEYGTVFSSTIWTNGKNHLFPFCGIKADAPHEPNFENNHPPQKSMTGLQIDSKRMKNCAKRKWHRGSQTR